jgi:lauroyl/myristoyl acyltransferase
MTAEKAVDYLKHHPLQGLPAAARNRIVEGMAERVNRLTFEERQKFRYEGSLRKWFEEMTEAERRRYIDLTLPKGMKQMMEAFNKMEPAKRKQVVNRALNDLERHRGEIAPKDVNKAMSDENVKHIIDQGMKSFYTDANADAKLDLQPLIEQIQNIMQMGR